MKYRSCVNAAPGCADVLSHREPAEVRGPEEQGEEGVQQKHTKSQGITAVFFKGRAGVKAKGLSTLPARWRLQHTQGVTGPESSLPSSGRHSS